MLLAVSSVAMAQVVNDPGKSTPPPSETATATATETPTPDAAATSSSGAFTSVAPADHMTSQLIGLDIYNSTNQDIGSIKDVVFGADGVKAYIVGVGGFLGMDEHYVAVRPSAVTLRYNSAERIWHATMDTSVDQLKAAPSYSYPTKL